MGSPLYLFNIWIVNHSMLFVQHLDLDVDLLCYMDSGASVGCRNMSKCRNHPISISRIRGHAKNISFVSIFLLFSMVNSVYKVSLRVSCII